MTKAKVTLLLLERLKSTFPALSDEQRSQIRDWIGAEVDDDKEWMVDLSILFEDSSVWGSSVGGLMIGSEEFLTLVPNPQHWDGFNKNELIENALKTMESSATLDELSLVIAINPGLLNRSQLDRLWSHLDKLISMPELDFSQETHKVWLTLFARASAHLDRRHEFFKRLKPLARFLAKQDGRGDDILDPNPSPGSRAAAYSGFVDAIIAFIAECNAPLHEKGRILFEQLGEIAEAWPDTGSSTLRLMSTLLNQMPSEAANDCWPIMRQARSHL
ncbi:MAG: hypothetical protein NXH88_05105 [Hyphomonas sp.]|nr:hypothetical protein [Hyphomonas sp.]